MSESRGFAQWCFTINNYTNEDVRAVFNVPKEYSVVFGQEVGKKETKHLQGTLWREDDVRVRRAQVEKVLGGRAHLEPCRALVASVGYCCKDGCWFTVNCGQDDLKRVRDILFTAKKICEDNEWLGWTFFNHYGYPQCPSSEEDLRSYYNAYLFNTH